MARDSADPSATVSNDQYDRESEPEILGTNDRRATLPPNYDPARIEELEKLFNCKTKKELEKMNIDTLWNGLRQAGMALLHWELHADEQNKQINELQTILTRKEGIVEFLTKQGSSKPRLLAKHPNPTLLDNNTNPKFEH